MIHKDSYQSAVKVIHILKGKTRRFGYHFCWGIVFSVLLLTAMPTPAQTLSEKVLAMEIGLEQEFESYFGADLAEVTQPPEEIANTLSRIGAETGTTPAVLWAIPRGDHLHLVLLTPNGEPVVRDLYDVPDETLRATVRTFHLEVNSVSQRTARPAAQQLYRWMIEPYEDDFLAPAGVDTLLFCLGNGLRGIPLAALYDGESFLLEKYSLTRIPAFNLIQTDYVDLEQSRFLAMGAAEFEDLEPLPAVPSEITRIWWELQYARSSEERWQGQTFLNQQFTQSNLVQAVNELSPQVIHLATHAAFEPGAPQNSYVQFWDAQLSLDEMDSLEWPSPSLELLVLSACQTAVGDDEAELGFAGLALKAGFKSAIASLWNVSDVGTLALMSEFYRQLGGTSTKAEALRQAQLKMLRGEIRYEDGALQLSRGSVPIAPELAAAIASAVPSDFSSPYFWAGFTMISSPW